MTNQDLGERVAEYQRKQDAATEADKREPTGPKSVQMLEDFNAIVEFEDFARNDTLVTDLWAEVERLRNESKLLVEACENFRDNVLHSDGYSLDNDQVNEVLTMYDEQVGPFIPAESAPEGGD